MEKTKEELSNSIDSLLNDAKVKNKSLEDIISTVFDKLTNDLEDISDIINRMKLVLDNSKNNFDKNQTAISLTNLYKVKKENMDTYVGVIEIIKDLIKMNKSDNEQISSAILLTETDRKKILESVEPTNKRLGP